MAAVAMSLLFCSCSLDDDTRYTPETKAAYFLVPTTAGRQVVEWRTDGTLTTDWQSQFDISQTGLGDMQFTGEHLYLSDKEGKRIIQINLEDGGVKERFFTGDLVPNHFAVGQDFILVCDSAASKLGYMRIRNGKQTVLEAPRHPSLVIYQNLKFYIVMDSHWLSIWNEKAATEMVAYEFAHPIVELQLDAFSGVHAVSVDSAGRYGTSFDNNSTLILSKEAPIPTSQERYTPWIRQLYEQEWLTNVNLRDGALDLIAFPDSCASFEMDFFESRTFLFSGDSLRVRNLRTGALSPSAAFDGLPLKAAVFVGERGE
jgi:hypothetical protein